jgi:Bacterial Ig domain
MTSKSLRSTVATLIWLIVVYASAQATTCPIPTNPGVVICTPTTESTVPSPVEISAAAKGSAQLSSWKIYVDGISVWKSEAFVSSIDPSISMAVGQHRVTVKVWDVNGGIYSQTIFITVMTTTGSGCTGTVDRSIVICSPLLVRGGRISITAKAIDQRPVSAMRLYVNGTSACRVDAETLASNGNTLQCAPFLLTGSNRLTVKAWDSLGSFSKSLTVIGP